MKRKCPFYPVQSARLTRHMSGVHAGEAEVKENLNLSDKLATAFAYLHNKGILKRNKEMKDRSELERVKRSAFPNPKTDNALQNLWWILW